MYRKYHSKQGDLGSKWDFFPDTPAGLGRQLARSPEGADCFTTLNVWPDFSNEEFTYYDYGFDFDHPNVAISAKDALALVAWLDNLETAYTLHFSGSKGIHVVVPHQAANILPRADGGQLCRLLQEALKVKLQLDTLDTGIHGKTRMWRVPNTVNSKTGLLKVYINKAELEAIADRGIDAAREVAAQPRAGESPRLREFSENFAGVVSTFVPDADALLLKRQTERTEAEATAFKHLPVCIQGILHDPAKIVRQANSWGKQVPSRNKLTTFAAAFMKNHMKVERATAQEVLGPSWQKKIQAISSSSLSQIHSSTSTCISSVYNNDYFFSCGAVISHGCECYVGCPMYRPYEKKDE